MTELERRALEVLAAHPLLTDDELSWLDAVIMVQPKDYVITPGEEAYISWLRKLVRDRTPGGC